MNCILLKTILMLLTLGCPVDSRAAKYSHGRLLGRSNADSMSVWARPSCPTRLQDRYGQDANQHDQISPRVLTKTGDDNPEIATLSSIYSKMPHHCVVFSGVVFSGVSEFRGIGCSLKTASHKSTTPLTISSNQGILAGSSTHAPS